MRVFLDRNSGKSINNLLHKYSAINGNLYSILINSELWFSNPEDFNDPYDCNLSYDLSNINYEQVYSYLLTANETLKALKTTDFLKKRANEICNYPSKIGELLNDLSRNQTEERGICCFSESDVKLLMWSHYSNSHKGVCLTFDINKDEEFFKYPYKVDYPDNYPKIDPFDNSKSTLQNLFATKSKEWDYESEVRIIKEKGKRKYRGAITFNPEALTEIKFGYKAAPEQIQTVMNLVAIKYPHAKIYTSSLKKNNFGLEFQSMN